jgi:hypothetical protein
MQDFEFFFEKKKKQNSTICLPVKYEVCEKRAFQSVPSSRSGRCIKSSDYPLLNYPCIPSASISLDNREYTLVPTILFESPKEPSDKKCLRPMKPLIRPCVCAHTRPHLLLQLLKHETLYMLHASRGTPIFALHSMQ